MKMKRIITKSWPALILVLTLLVFSIFNYRDPNFIPYLSALSGTLAGLVALYISIKNELVSENRRRAEQEQICTNLVIELDNIAFDLKYIVGSSELSAEAIEYFFEKKAIDPVRPFYESLGDRMLTLPAYTVSAIARNQSKYERALRRYRDALNKPNPGPIDLRALYGSAGTLRKTLVKYMHALVEAQRQDFPERYAKTEKWLSKLPKAPDPSLELVEK